MERASTSRSLENHEIARLLGKIGRSSGIIISEDDRASVEDALMNEGFEIVSIDISSAIEGSSEDPLQKVLASLGEKDPEIVKGIVDLYSFDGLLQRINLAQQPRKFAFFIKVPSDRPSQAKDPAYNFLMQVLKNGRGFSRVGNTKTVAVLIYDAGKERPYNQTNECAHFERK